MPHNQPYPGTQAVLRAVALLKAFEDNEPDKGLTALAHAVGLNKATTYRLLTALESEGLIAKSGVGENYRLGPELIALGVRALRSNDLQAVSRPELELLAHDTGETATLEVLVGIEVLILDEVVGQHLINATHELGTRWHAYATSTGKAILAALPESALHRALPARLATFTPKTARSRAALYAELERIRKQGYATAVEELEEGFVAIGAAVLDQQGHPAAAISIGGPKVRLTTQRIVELAPRVKLCAARISEKLGFKVKATTSRNANTRARIPAKRHI